MAMVRQSDEVEAAVARAACAVADAEAALARARRGLRLACDAYAARLARASTEDRPRAADYTASVATAGDLLIS